jgi:3'-phosphoadenosine 5'-phosphosulfate sulfotransferase (PAPS reductase)/FAD synthetase
LSEDVEAVLVFRSDRHSGVVIEKGDWKGIAVFPPAVPSDDVMQHRVAKKRYDDLQTDIDAEDLLREWGDPEGHTLVEYIEVEAEAEDRQGLGEDLPDIIPVERLARPKKNRKAAKTVFKPKPPYSRRNYPKPDDAKPNKIKLRDLRSYDHIVVSFSGGKDSVACALHLLELGVDPKRIELWHQAVDGKPGVAERFWDWPCTESYCEAFAKAFGMRLLFQWKDGGYLGELTRRNVPTAPTTFQTLNGREITTGGEGKPATRLVFPALSADLMTRWCSAYLKIDVAKKVFSNDPRFNGKKTLVLTGERREESGNRARYEDVTDYASTQTRTVHQWRAVLGWFEQDVWEIFEKYRVRPHPAYHLGWSRVSCLPCIFGNPDQWASVRDLTPEVFARLAGLEDKFYAASQKIPDHPWSAENQKARHLRSEKRDEPFKPKSFDGFLRSGESLAEAADRGTSFILPAWRKNVALAMSEHYDQDVILGPDESWETPVGAYKHSGGPT